MIHSDIENILTRAGSDKNKLETDLQSLEASQTTTKTVFCVDIYEYSKMSGAKQFLVPFVIDTVFTNTIQKLSVDESAFFTKSDLAAIQESLIDTGDGFFVILADPMKAFVFVCHLAMEIETLRSRNKAHTLMKIVEDYVFRFSIATGSVFEYKKRFYGEAIIRCARIIASDKLNRCLIDKDTFIWFYNNTNGLESIQDANFQEVLKTGNTSIDPGGASQLFPNTSMENLAFKTIMASKVGKIEVKKDQLDIYNMYVQTSMRISASSGPAFPFVTSVGTTNMNGIGTP